MRSLTRRSMLVGVGQSAAGVVVGSAQTGSSKLPERKLKVVVAGGHPGDPEYGCGGTVARLTDHGHEVVLLYLNRGNWRTFSEATRTAEATKACEILKARPAWVGQKTDQAIVDPAHYQQYRELLEREAPDVVFSQWPIDSHPDHRAIAMLTYDAWLRMGKKFALYYYEVSNGEDTLMFSPNHYIDITQTVSRKHAACYAHASATPDRFYALQDHVARFRGIESGYERAEAFLLQVESPSIALPIEGPS